MESTYAGLAIKSEREPIITLANEIALPIGALTMSAYFFIQTLIYICTEKVTHTVHLKMGHIYKGPLIFLKSSCAKHISLYKNKKKGFLPTHCPFLPSNPSGQGEHMKEPRVL